MKNTLLFSLLVTGLALTGCNKTTKTSTASTYPSTDTSTTTTTAATTPSTTTPATTDTFGAKVDRAGDRVADASREAADKVRDASHDTANAMRNMGHDLSARMTEWRLNTSDIEADVNANRPVVRTRTNAGAPTGKIDKGNIEKSIKGELRADLPNDKFDVNCNSKGQVELEGKARTMDDIAHAMAVALNTDGVTQVTSKVKISPKVGPNNR